MPQLYCISPKAEYNPQIKEAKYKRSSDTASEKARRLCECKPPDGKRTDVFGIATPASQEGLVVCRKTNGGGGCRRTGIVDFRP